jgi:hypothetical protein
MLDQFDFDIAPEVIARLDFDGTFGAAGKSTGMSHGLKVARDDQITRPNIRGLEFRDLRWNGSAVLRGHDGRPE